MEPRIIMASKFKEQCLALLDLVESTKVAIIVTKHGRPVAQLTPLADTPAPSPRTRASGHTPVAGATYARSGSRQGSRVGDGGRPTR